MTKTSPEATVLSTSQPEHSTLEAMAETIHKARWPADRQMAITPFADEDKNGREYCFRIARAVLAAPPASPLRGRKRIAVAEYLLARDEADVNVPVPHGLILWARNLLANGKDAVHSGDCTNECHSCVRCTADRALRQADEILVLVSASPPEQPAEWHWRVLDDNGHPDSKWFVVDGPIEDFKNEMEADTYEIRPLYIGTPPSFVSVELLNIERAVSDCNCLMCIAERTR